jgi:hypothetical protein
MQKLSRSLIALSGLALLAACGDDVSITPPPEPTPATIAKVDVVPAQLTIKVGEKVILTASVTVNPGAGSPATTVTWASANTAIATVSAAGEVTGVAPGTTSIRATSTADPTKIGAAAITVGAIAPATVSIKSVTTGTTNTPVNFTNVRGQIDVTLNVEPGDQVISKVEVLIDGNVACTQAFSGLQSAEELAEALAEIVCSIQTNKFDPVTGAVTYLNGVHQLTARAILVGGTSVATPSTALTFNNQSGFIVTVANTGTNAGSPAAATNPTTGLGWTQGTHDVKAVGVNYAPGGVTVSSVNANLFGVNTPLAIAAGTQSFSASFVATSTWNGTNLRLGSYLSPAAGEAPAITASTLSNGQPGATTILNLGALADSLGLTKLNPIRVDNTAPGVTSANAIVQAPPVLGVMPNWVNASFTFVPSAVFTSGGDIGANAVTRTYYSIAGALPGAANSCTFTGMEVVTTGADLDATLVSTTYRTRVADKDALGNVKCWDLVLTDAVNTTGTNGADFVAPTVTAVSAPTDQTGYNAVTIPPVANVAFTVTDNASGFGTNPFRGKQFVITPTATTYIIGSSTATATAPLTFASLSGGSTEGYYTVDGTIEDQAGNTTPGTTRTYLYDNTLPALSGGVSLAPLYTGNQPATFTTTATDNLDLASAHVALAYGAAGHLEYEPQAIGAFGSAAFTTSSAVTYTIAQFVRCVNGITPTQVHVHLSDFANTNTAPVFPLPAANVEACVLPVGNVPIVGITVTPPSGVGPAPFVISKNGATASTPTSITFSVVVEVPLNTSLNPFQRMVLQWQDAVTGYWREFGSGTAVLSQSPTQRFWTFSFSFDPDARFPNGIRTLRSMGVDDSGDAGTVPLFQVNIVP